MEKLQVYRNSSVEWKPSPVIALATSADGAQVAAAREDGALEIWLVSPGSVGWHCQLTIQGDPSSRVSSLVWCRPSTKGVGPGRLLSSSIDGSISEWDLFSLKQKIVLDSVGVSIWHMALEPSRNTICAGKFGSGVTANGFANHEAHSDSESSKIDEDEDDNDSDELNAVHSGGNCQRLAVACDDGCVRVYGVPDTGALIYIRAFPRVSGRILSVAWSNNVKLVFSGSSDGFIRCWDATSFHEVYRITAGLGGMGSGSELCIWSLLFLRCGTLVSGDSTGSVQFWDSHHGTLLQAHSYHKGDVNALATVPGHNRIFSAGSDGQVILYKLSNDAHGSGEEKLPQEQITKWVYVGYVRAHTHDVRALTMAVPISREDSLPDVKMTKKRRRDKPIDFSYRKWAKLGVPMLISAGDDTKLFAYSAKEFTLFSPHDICPAPQRPLIKLVPDSVSDGASVMLLQSSCWLDVCLCKPDDNVAASMSCGKSTSTQHLARLKSKGSRKIICSSISSNGMLFAYSDHMKPCLFELRRPKGGKRWSLEKIQLPKGLPYAHSMVFTVDSSCLMLAGHDRKIYVVDVKRSEIIDTLIPQRKVDDITSLNEPPITRMYTSMDGQWLAAVSCFGDIYIFNLELQRQHWFIYRMNDASVTAGGFSPRNSSVLVITTSSNEVYVFDVEAKQLGEWSRRHSHHLPRRFQEFPGEVIGLSFPPSCLTSVIVYSSRAMCFVDFGMPVDQDDEELPNNSDPSLEKYESSKNARAKKKKRKNLDEESRRNKRKNFDLCAFKDPVLFVGHLSESSILIMEKRWMEVAQSFDAPVHRHIFGT